MTERKAPDWERIEADYRAGVLSLREIAGSHGSSPAGILKRAKRDGWERDLGAKIKAKADALVNKAAVNSEVNSKTAVSEREIIEANASRIAQVRGEHRHDIARMRRIVLDLLVELECQTGNVELFEQLGKLLRSEDDRGQDKRNEVYQKVISTAGRIDGLKKLAEAMKILIGLEREAYGIDSAPESPDKPRSFAEMYGGLSAVPQSQPA